MRSKMLALGLLASTALVTAASAQTMNKNENAAPAPSASSASTATTTNSNKTYSNVWRASKLMGLDIYNEQNEKLGDIDEILLDKTGKVEGVIIGVGGFLGVGTRDIKVSMDQLKFVDEPVRTSSAAPGSTSNTTPPAKTTASNTTTASDARATSTSSSSSKQWYPDHAVLSGASKDQLKAMPEFKYD